MAEHSKGFVPGHYLSRSWALLTRDSGWVKPVLVLSLVALVPIIGPIAVLGYALEWARLTAWGIDAAPKQKRVDVGQVLLSGWRGTVVLVVWELVLGVVYGLLCLALDHVPGQSEGSFAGGLLDAIYLVAEVLLMVIVMVAQVRSAIYQRIGAGLRANRVFDMTGRDFGGLMHMLGMRVLGWVVELCVTLVFGVIVLAVVTPYIVGYSSGSVLIGSYALGRWIAGILGSLAVPIVLFVYAISVVSQVVLLLTMTGVALWMRQFDVPSWGKSADPLPGGRGGKSRTKDGEGDTTVSQVPTDAAATRTTTTIVREPGKKPVVETRTEVIRDRGVIPLGPATGDDSSADPKTGDEDPDSRG